MPPEALYGSLSNITSKVMGRLGARGGSCRASLEAMRAYRKINIKSSLIRQGAEDHQRSVRLLARDIGYINLALVNLPVAGGNENEKWN